MSDPVPNLANELDRHGSVSFERFQELALYGPGGFYERGGAGRRRDFVTSPEVGPLFGELVARQLDRWWAELSRPDPFVAIEAGAGSGRLAHAVLTAEPACLSALRYVLVDRAEAQRRQQADLLDLEPAAEAFADPLVDDEGEPIGPAATGPVVVSLSELPKGPVVGAVLANELLDNLVVALVERGAYQWLEVRVTRSDDGNLTELLVPAPEWLADLADRLVPEPTTGSRLPIQRSATEWLRTALGLLQRGRVLVVDYARSTADMAARAQCDWLRTYRGHEPGGSPLDDPGTQDITCDVAVDQLAVVQPPESDATQADWLRDLGCEELVAEGRARWHERASVGDLAAVRARSRVGEAEALLDPGGHGAFRVLTWRV